MTFYPPAYRPKSSERPRISERISAFPEQPGTAPSSAFERRKRVRTIQPQSATGASPAINVTPLIDVVLVLLIVFMAVTPTRVDDIEVQLVATGQSDSSVAASSQQLVLTIEDAGSLRLNDEAVERPKLAAKLQAVLSGRERGARTLYVIAGDRVAYATLVETIEAARHAGITATGFVTDATP